MEKTRLCRYKRYVKVIVERIEHSKHVVWMYRLDINNSYINWKRLRVSYCLQKGGGHGVVDHG